MPTFAIVTFGCRVNTGESLALEAALREAGARPAPAEAADVVLVNTCSVTAAADQGARQAIRRLARRNPAVRVLVSGCYASRRPDDLAALPGVIAVVPNSSKPQLATLVGSLFEHAQGLLPVAGGSGATRRIPGGHGPVATARADGAPADLWMKSAPAGPESDGHGPCGSALQPGVAGRTAWTLAVQVGCDQACSYCVIPRTRGAGRSVPIETVCEHLLQAVERGYREVVIAGVHLGAYGRDLSPGSSLAALLDAVARTVDGLGVRIRVSSVEPMDCSRELLDVMTGAPCFARHFHLPLQHGADRVLLAMRRPYILSRYAAVADEVRRRVPDAAIGTDVMLGFPGETDDDVDALCRYLESSPLTALHVFPYSDRPGTEAASLAGSVHGTAVHERASRVRAIGQCLHDRFLTAQVGTEHEALTLDDGTLALTGNYCKVRIPAGLARNEWVRVRVLTAGAVMTGEVVGSGKSPRTG
jgi:threonylcarbamoyladenosine tRNA methylthiotransferase MtaB